MRDGDVLPSIKGRIGNFALAEDVSGDVNINQGVVLLRFNDTLPLWWVLAFLDSPFGKLQVQQNSTGGINPFLGLANVRKLLVPVFQEQMMRDVGDRTHEQVWAARAACCRATRVEIAIEQDESAALTCWTASMSNPDRVAVRGSVVQHRTRHSVRDANGLRRASGLQVCWTA